MKLLDNKPFDLAIAGELNLDLILYGLPLMMETEQELLGTNFVATLGSSSAIVAHNAATLGLRVRFATLVGDDLFGRHALDLLKQAGVDTTDAIVDRAVTTGVSIQLPHGNVRHSLSFLGSINALTVDHLNLAHFAQAAHLHLSSLFLQSGLHCGLVDFLRDLKSTGLTISLDTNGDPANRWGHPVEEVIPFVDVFLPNQNEICRLAGDLELDRALAVFADRVRTIVVKRGPLGCRVREHGQVRDYPGVAVSPIDTIGAGDSFDAGFLCAYLREMDIADCARAGNIAGALSTLSSGGTEAFRNRALRESFLREQGYPLLGE